jgi:DNA-directed RNA polymerase subunit omega
MIYPSADKIEKQVDSRYALVILAAKRAKQIKEGSRSLIKTDSTNPLTIALEEIAEGEVRFRFDETSLAGREALADKEAVIGRRDLEVEGLDPLAMPEPDDNYARAASALGADLEDYLTDDEGELEEVLAESDEVDEEEENPLLLADDEEVAEV